MKEFVQNPSLKSEPNDQQDYKTPDHSFRRQIHAVIQETIYNPNVETSGDVIMSAEGGANVAIQGQALFRKSESADEVFHVEENVAVSSEYSILV